MAPTPATRAGTRVPAFAVCAMIRPVARIPKRRTGEFKADATVGEHKQAIVDRRSPRGIFVDSGMYTSITHILDTAAPIIRQRIEEKKQRKERVIATDPVEWMESRFYIPSTGQPIVLYPHQKAYLKLALTRDENEYFPYRTLIYSTIKQSGKSTIAAAITRWYAETQRRRQECYTIGNDMEQAKNRSFREIRWSLEETPGFNHARDILPGEWIVQKTQMKCLLTGTEIRALPVDAKGEAGGKPAIQVWTELWGAENEDALRFWDELTPIPTIPDSMRMIETYAGYDGESLLLQSQYELGLAGRQLTEGELRKRTGIAHAFAESPNDDDLVPIWENKAASVLMYWDSGPQARRMPWQQGERGNQYYAEQELSLLPNAFDRLHNNYWTSSSTGFIRAEHWDACAEELEPIYPGDRTPIVVAVDAATTNDCFAIVAVSRHPDPARKADHVAVRACKVWNPKDNGGTVDYAEAEMFLRRLVGGHCASPDRHPKSLPDADCAACKDSGSFVPGFNVVMVTYDPYQLTSMMQRLGDEQIVWCDPFNQGSDRLMADKQLYDDIISRRIVHPKDQADEGMKTLRSHIIGAGAKASREDSTLRLVKRSPTLKIDAAVATSMANARCRWLNL